METQIINATEYRNVSLSLLSESKTNPRHIFEENALKELAATIRSQGVLSPLLVRPLTETGFEIVFGARRYRAAQLAEQDTVPVRIKQMTDAEVIEAQLIELSIVGKSFLCLYATSARRLYVIDVPSLPQIAGYNGMPPPRAMECGR